jgi:hypothetical protein
MTQHLPAGDHASRPDPTTYGGFTQPPNPLYDALYPCTTHGVIYRCNGTTWSTWATLGSGSGGYALAIDESGASFANFTAVTGTWDSNGTVIRQTDTADVVTRARYSAALVDTTDLIAQVDVRFDTVTDERTGGLLIWPGDGTTGGLDIRLHLGGSDNVELQRDGVMAVASASATINTDTWYTLRARINGPSVAVYLDGALKLSGQAAMVDLNTSRIGLRVYSGPVHFRNFKTWALALPA